jgi:hypothetical protein
MKAIKKHENYITFNIDEIGQETLNSLIGKALKLCDTTSVSEELAYYAKPMYKTQIPYNSGFVQERFVYYNTTGISEYIVQEMEQPRAFHAFFCVYTCLDFYDKCDLVLSVNIVGGIVTVDSTRIDLSKYGYWEGEPANENE